MASSRWRPQSLVVCVALLLALSAAAAPGQQGTPKVLHIGTSGSFVAAGGRGKEEAATKTLRAFIKEETGMDNEIVRAPGWRELADKMAKGGPHLGVFQGYEFAWAQAQHPKLKGLAVAVNVYRYPVAYVVARRDSSVTNFAGLKGKAVAIPATSEGYLRLFVERQTEALGQKPDAFLAKVTQPENAEDAIDDVVDGTVAAAVTDRAALEGYKRRKPGRFRQLKEIAKSPPFPPTVIGYYDAVLPQATLTSFRKGLLHASKTERGETMLTMFRLTAFEAIPDDFDRVLAETRRTYPPSPK